MPRKKIIFIDKALPKKKMGVVDKIIWFHKIGVKTAFLNLNPNCTLKLKIGHPTSKEKHLKSNKPSVDTKKSAAAEPKNVADESEGRESLGESDTKGTLAKNTSEGRKEKETIEEPVVTSDNEWDSSDLSDSDGSNLVIEEDTVESLSPVEISKRQEHTQPKAKPNAEITSPKLKSDAVAANSASPTTPESDSKKPVTRSVSKMLENLNKIEKLLGKETNTARKPTVTRKLMIEQKFETVQEAQSLSEEERNEPNKEEETPKQLNKKKRGAVVRRNFLDLLLEDQKKMFSGNDNPLEMAKSDQKFLRKKDVFEFDPHPVPEGCNYVYRPFILRRKDLSVGAFRTLVRCKYDAADSTKRGKKLTIVPKLEFQPEFGAEAVTISELTRHWLSLLMKPNSTLIRARINAFTSKVIMVEQMEMKDIAKEERRLGMQASSCLSSLYSVFRAIADIPPGQYVLSHNAKLGAFANLYRAIDTARDGCYDLHKQYQIDPSVEEPQNIANLWMPVDFGIITPFHEKCNRVPGTFNPLEKSKKKGKKKKK